MKSITDLLSVISANPLVDDLTKLRAKLLLLRLNPASGWSIFA